MVEQTLFEIVQVLGGDPGKPRFRGCTPREGVDIEKIIASTFKKYWGIELAWRVGNAYSPEQALRVLIAWRAGEPLRTIEDKECIKYNLVRSLCTTLSRVVKRIPWEEILGEDLIKDPSFIDISASVPGFPWARIKPSGTRRKKHIPVA